MSNLSKLSKRALAAFLGAVIMLSCFSSAFGVVAAAADDIGTPWDGSSVKTPAQASDGYYLISDGAELAWFRNQIVNNNNRSINGRLTANINLNDKVWNPIGNHDRQYAGTFDGQGFTISNVYVNSTSVDRGLFGKITTSGVIKNVNVNNITIAGTRDYSGGLLGVAVGGTISNCHVTGINISAGRAQTGGLIGQVEGAAVITDCSVTGTSSMKTIVGTNNTGGLVGYIKANNVQFRNCRVENLNISSTSSNSRIAGAIGHADYRFDMYDTIVKGVNVTGTRYMGGLAFAVKNGSFIERCMVLDSTITSTQTSATTDVEIGGLIGVVTSDVANTIQYNAVYNTTVSSAGRMSGGFIGKIEAARHFISENYSAATLNLRAAPTRAGTLVGYVANAELNDLFYVTASGQNAIGEQVSSSTVTNIRGVTAAEATNGALLSYLNNLTNIWKTGNDGYPVIDGNLAVAPSKDASGYFLIGSAFQLEWFQKHVNAGNTSASAKLVADINLNNKKMDTIGNNNVRYAGTFDGQNFTISNLYISKTGNDKGLFGSTAPTAVLRNLKLKNVYINTNGSYVGGLVGLLRGTVSNITVEGMNINGASYVGGVIGQSEASTQLNNITVIGETGAKTIKGTGSFVGGVAGNIKATMPVNNVIVKNVDFTANEKAGGVFGDSDGGTVRISEALVENVNISVNHYAGGVIFSVRNASTVDKATVRNVRITGGAELGGISGTSNGNPVSVTNSLVENFTCVSNNERTGGIIGYINNKATITDTIIKDSSLTGTRYIGGVSYSLKDGSFISRVGVINVTINATNTGTGNEFCVGGLIGVVGWNTANTIQYNYVSNVTITGVGRMIGGFIGKMDNANHAIAENYADASINNNTKIYVGSFLGYKSSGNVVNNFARANGFPRTGGASAGASGDVSGITEVSLADIRNGSLTEMLNDITDLWAQYNDDYVNGFPVIANAEPPALVNGYYEIKNTFQLEWFRNFVNDGNVNANAKLIADINIRNKEWIPIGTDSRRYNGIFDGNNHSISNFKIQPATYDRGLFGSTNPNAVIKNLTLRNVSLNSTSEYVGAVVGLLRGKVENVTVEGVNIVAKAQVGGIAGQIESNGSIKDSSVIGLPGMNVIRGTGNNIGGLAGNIKTTSYITNVSSKDLVINANERAGGISGDTDGGTGHFDTVNVDNVTISVVRYGGGVVFGLRNASSVNNAIVKNVTINGAEELGGIAGCTSGSEVKITKSLVENYTGNSTSERTGGIIGYINSTASISDTIIRNSSIKGSRYIGGVSYTAMNGTKIIKVGVENVTITATNTNASTDICVGGLIGVVGWNTGNTIQYSYAQNVTITATGRMVGGLIGKIDTANHQILENYANANISGNVSTYGGSFVGYRTSGTFANNFAKPISGLPLAGYGASTGISEVSLQDIKNGNLTEMLNNVTDIWAQYNNDYENGYPVIGNAEPPQLVNGYYEIETAFQLEWFKNYVNAGNTNANAKLLNDINLRNKDWYPIGNNDRRYTGTFDGQGFTVRNVLITTTSVDRGFFGKLGSGGVVKNLNLENVQITTNRNYTGGLVGVLNNASVINCHVRGIKITNTGQYIGGLVGQTEGTITIADSSVTGTETMNTIVGSSYVGGFVGRNDTSNANFMNNVVNGVNVSATATDSRAGGFAGYNEGTIFAYDNLVKNTDITGGRYLGGFTFAIRDDSVVERNGVVNTKVNSTYNSPATDIEIGGFAGVIVSNRVGRIQFNYVVDSEITSYGRVSGGFAGKVESARHKVSENYSDTLVNIIGTPTRTGTAFGWLTNGEISTLYYVPKAGQNAIGEYNTTPLINNVTPIEKAEVKNGSLLEKLNDITPIWEASEDGYPVPQKDLVSAPEKDADGYYLIYNSYQYEWVTRFVNSGNPNTRIKLMADINLNGKNIDPLGTNSSRYSGIFDGNGFEISNLYISKTANDIGLLGSTTNAVVVKNLTLRNVDISTTASYVGAVAGLFRGRMENVHVIGLNIRGTSSVGGLAGQTNENVTLINCSVTGTETMKTISGSNSNVGGVIGYVDTSGLTLTDVSVKGVNISAGTERAGGIAGDTSPKMTFTNISVEDTSVTAPRYIGGLVFYLRNGSTVNGATVKNVTLTGTSAVQAEIGGISGSNSGTASTINNAAVENLTINTPGECVGGILGLANSAIIITNSTVKNSTLNASRYMGGISYNLGYGSSLTKSGVENVTLNASNTSTTNDIAAGGLVGVVGWGTANTVQYNYVDRAAVNAVGRMTGGLIGKIDNANHSVSYNYVNDTSVTSGAIYTGSLVGYRTSGTFSNNFVVGSSALPLVGSDKVGTPGNVAGTALAEVFTGDIETSETPVLLSYYISATDFIKSFQNQNVVFLKEGIFSELYDEISAILVSIAAELARRLDSEISVLKEFYDEYGMICIFNYELIGTHLGTVTNAIAQYVTLPPETQANYEFYLQLIDDFNDYLANHGYNSFYEATVGYTVRKVREDDIARYESPRDDFPVTYEKMQNVVSRLDALLLSDDFATLAGLESSLSRKIKDILAEELYNNEIINDLMSSLYPKLIEELESAIEENAEIDLKVTKITFRGRARDLVDDLLRKFNLWVYPTYLADQIDPKYAAVRSVLYSADKDWSKVNFDDPEAPNYLDWGELDKEGFIDALSNSLKGIYPVLRAALTANSFNDRKNSSLIANIDVSIRLQINAVDAYDRAIVPLLEMLNITGFMPAAEYNNLTSVKGLLENILNPLLTWIEEEIPTAPFSNIMEMLPNIAYSLQFGLVESWLRAIKTTIYYDIDGVFDYWLGDIDFDIANGEYAFDAFEMLSEEEDDILYGADLSSINGILKMVLKQMEIDVELPPINNKYFASLGSVVYLNSATRQQTRGYIQGDSAKVAYVILRYIFNILSDEELVRAILGEEEGEDKLDGTIGDIVRNIGNSPEDAIAAIVELCNPVEYDVRGFDYGGPFEGEYPKVQYSQYWTKQQAKFITDHLDTYIDNILKLLGLKPAGELLREKLGELYTNDTLTNIILGARDALESLDSDGKILKVLDVDITPWYDVDYGYDWGFEDGDKDAFLRALCDALSPLNNAIGLFLADMDYNIMDGEITIKGYNGYKNAIVPLLEAIGCDYDEILTGEEYLAAVEADPNSMIELIIKPIFGLLERLYAAPTETIFSILPNLIYFLDSGVLDTAILNLVQPILVAVDTIRPIYSLEFEFSASEYIKEAIRELVAENGITLPDINLSDMLKAYAKPKTNVHGEEIYVIDADNEDVLTVMLRYIVATVFHPANAELIKSEVIDEAGLSGDSAAIIKAAFETFGELINKENGADQVLGMFYYIFYGTDLGFGHGANFLDNLNENWRKALEMLSNSESEFLRNMAGALNELMKDYLVGIIDEGGLAPNGVLRFFQRIAEFFRNFLNMLRNLFK